MSVTITLTRRITPHEAGEIIDWLNKNIVAHEYKFVGTTMELLTFESEEQALIFRLTFGI